MSAVTDISGMFKYSEAFDQDLNNWNTEKVLDTQRIFQGAAALTHDIKWANKERVMNDSSYSRWRYE